MLLYIVHLVRQFHLGILYYLLKILYNLRLKYIWIKNKPLIKSLFTPLNMV